MLRYIFAGILLLIVLGIAPSLADHQGLVHIEVAGYIVETSLLTAIVCLIIFCGLLYVCLGFLASLFNLHKGLLAWSKARNSIKTRKLLEQSLVAYLEQDFATSLTLAKKTLPLAQSPKLSYLGMLLAASQVHSEKDAEEVFARLAQMKVSPYSILLMRMYFYLHATMYQEAFNVITAIRNQYDTNKVISAMYWQCCINLQRYDLVYQSRQEFKKFGLLDAKSYAQYIVRYLVKEIEAITNKEKFITFVDALGSDVKDQLSIQASLAQKYYHFGDTQQADKYVQRILKQNVDDSVIYQTIATLQYGSEELLQQLLDISTKLHEKGERDLDLQSAIANMYLQLGRYDDAITLYYDLLNKKPSDLLYSKLGMCVQKEQNKLPSETGFTHHRY